VALHSLRYISLCTGAGGLDAGLHLALGDAQPLVYIERDVEAAQILAARLEDGSLPPAPLWSDLSSFNATPLRGMVDLVIGGLPCQPYSLAGKRQGESDDRYIWPSFFRILDACRASMVFLENVPPFVSGGYFRTIGEELCRMGYRIERPLFLGASDVGASHIRKRVFIFAWRKDLEYTFHGRQQNGRTRRNEPLRNARHEDNRHEAAQSGAEPANTTLPGCETRNSFTRRISTQLPVSGSSEFDLADAHGSRSGNAQSEFLWRSTAESGGNGSQLADPERTERRSHDERAGHSLEGSNRQGQAAGGAGESGEDLADPDLQHDDGSGHPGPGRRRESANDGGLLADGDLGYAQSLDGRPRRPESMRQFGTTASGEPSLPLFAPGPTDPRWPGILRDHPELAPAVEREVHKLASRVASRLGFSRTDQLRALGNAVTPACGCLALCVLMQRAGFREWLHPAFRRLGNPEESPMKAVSPREEVA
jgi:site-specific DNA-cytosine methylase